VQMKKNNTFNITMQNDCSRAVLIPPTYSQLYSYQIGSGEMRIEIPYFKSSVSYCKDI
jgi:hypothetical protein